jgi:hypothetical protein
MAGPAKANGAKPRTSTDGSSATTRRAPPVARDDSSTNSSLAPTQSQAPARRGQRSAPTGSFEDALSLDPDPRVNTLEDARKALQTGLYIPPGTGDVTTSQLANTLLILIHSVTTTKLGRAYAELFRAVAIMLHDEDTNNTAQLIASKVLDMQEATLAQLKTVSDKVGLAASSVSDAAASLEERANVLARQSDLANECTQDLAAATISINDAASELRSSTENVIAPTANSTGATYASVTATQAPITPANAAPRYAAARAKAVADERNVILDLSGDAAKDTAKLSEKELVDRANVAVDRMGLQAADKPDAFAFIAASKLEHGGIRYRMADKACADWLRRQDVREAFTAEFGGDGQLKDKSYAVIAEFADVGFNPADTDELNAVARVNGLAPRSITSARWLKRQASRRPGQQKAFLELVLASPNAANALIRAGCVILGRTLRTRKRLIEPRRCMKCQGFTARHTAKSCRAAHDTCAKCGDQHREDACTSDVRKCSNCKGAHAASDRACPRYLEEVRKLRERVPDNRYLLYVESDDPSTWEQDEEDTDAGQARPSAQQAGWRTATKEPRRGGGKPREQRSQTRSSPLSSQNTATTAAQSAGTQAAAGAGEERRSRSRTRQGGGTASPRVSSPLRQQTLHEVSPNGVLPSPARQRANSTPSAHA